VATFRLVLPKAPWLSCLEELRQCYSDALRKAGHAVTLSDTYLNPGEAGEDYQCAFGAHSVTPPDDFDRMVVMQSEHHAHHFRTEYIQTLGRAGLIVNMGPFTLPGLGGLTPSVEVPPGIMGPQETYNAAPSPPRGPATKDTIEVLHYGSVTPRRAQMLESLSKAGINVTALYGVLGTARDAYIDRAKVVLDLKQDGTEPDDQTRSWWPLSRGVCVLSENAPASATDACKLTPETIVQRVRYTLDVGAEGRRRLHSAYALALGPCDPSPMLRALGL
jgi:hypothetical protein